MSEELAAQIFSSTRQIAWVGVVPLLALLLAATWFDVRSHRIPNKLVFWGALAGVLLHVALPEGRGFISSLPGGLGFLDALAGLGIGLAVFLPVYLLRAMGAGDVKLMAMVGAFLGPEQIWGAMLGVALAGGSPLGGATFLAAARALGSEEADTLLRRVPWPRRATL